MTREQKQTAFQQVVAQVRAIEARTKKALTSTTIETPESRLDAARIALEQAQQNYNAALKAVNDARYADLEKQRAEAQAAIKGLSAGSARRKCGATAYVRQAQPFSILA